MFCLGLRIKKKLIYFQFNVKENNLPFAFTSFSIQNN